MMKKMIAMMLAVLMILLCMPGFACADHNVSISREKSGTNHGVIIDRETDNQSISIGETSAEPVKRVKKTVNTEKLSIARSSLLNL